MKFISKVYAYIELIRIINVIITFISVIVAVIISSDISSVNGTIILAAVCAAIVTAAGNVINDLWDIETDAVNKPDRPLPSEKITRKEALNFYFSLILLSIIISMSLSLIVFAIIILAHLLLLLYTTGLKKISFLGNFVISFLTGFVFIYGGLLTGNVNAAIIPASFALLINLSREGIKTIEDMPGDSRSGIITVPQKYGINFTRKLTSAFLVLLLVFTFVPFINGIYNIEYFIIVMAAVNPLLVYVIKNLLETSKIPDLRKLSFILKINMIVGLTAIYFGK
jgi:geranylgeranylglycerol-phosphate geranylgeranyltransferase